MTIRRIYALFLTAVAAAILANCGESYYDASSIHSAHEYLTRESRAEELVYAIGHSGLAGVALIAGAKESPVAPPFPDPGPPDDPNELVLKAGEQLPGLLIPFVTVPPGEADPVGLFQTVQKRRARGLALWRNGAAGERPLTDPALEPLYRFLEINGIPVYVSIKPEFLPELSVVLHDHAELKIVAGGFIGLENDLSRLRRILEYHSNLYTDTGFDAEPGFEKSFQVLTRDGAALEGLIEDMTPRILFAGGLLFDHRLYRHGIWGMQMLKAYRSFLEKSDVRLRLRDEKGYWNQVRLAGLSLDKDRLDKIYHENFKKVVGMSFHDAVTGDLNDLALNAPAGWSFDPMSNRRIVAALVGPQRKLVGMINQQRLRDIFAGRLTDWREINGEQGPIRLASYGSLVKIIADQLDAPLVATVDVFNDASALREAVEKRGDLLGILPFSELNGRLAVISVDGDNPCISHVRFCASKSAPTIANYFSTYPLLVPAVFPGDSPVESFDPFEIRTVFIGGRIRADSLPVAPAKSEERLTEKQAAERMAARTKPVYEVLPHVNRADYPIIFGRPQNDYESYLMRILGVRANVEGQTAHPFGADMGLVPANGPATVRGTPMVFSKTPEEVIPGAINIMLLSSDASSDDAMRGLEAGAAAVMSGSRLVAVQGIGLVRLDLGDFLGAEGASGAYFTISLYKDRVVRFEIEPVHTAAGAVQRRFGAESRSTVLAAFPAPQP